MTQIEEQLREKEILEWEVEDTINLGVKVEIVFGEPLLKLTDVLAIVGKCKSPSEVEELLTEQKNLMIDFLMTDSVTTIMTKESYRNYLMEKVPSALAKEE
jgi:hypothetical protein